MDLSKLPKLSQSPAPPPADKPTPEAPALAYAAPPAVGMGPEIWISAFMGIIFMLLGKTFASWLVATMTGQTFHTGVEWSVGERAGQEVSYWDLQGHTALSDAGIFLFGLSMVLEAVVMAAAAKSFKHQRAIVAFAFAIAASTTLLNLIVMVILFSDGITPLFTLVAVGFGGYIAWWEWGVLQTLRNQRETSPPAGRF